MTREEAIEILKAHHMWTGEPQEIIDVRKENKALDMAIQALSQEPTTTTNNNEPITIIYPTIVCDDAISRDVAIKALSHGEGCGNICANAIRRLPSVTQKSGKWIEEVNELGEITTYHCSKCYEDTGFTTDCKWKFCPNCGAKMVEPQESED